MSLPDLAPPATTKLVADCQLTVGQAVALKRDWLHALDGADALALDLSAVEQVDLAGVQLLLLLQREAARQGKPLHLGAVSGALRQLFTLLRVFPDAAEGRCGLADVTR
jgi:anti-sigma B factor antagonist